MKLIEKQAGNIQGFVMAIIGIAVVLAVGLVVLTELSASTACGTGYTYNATAVNCYLTTNASVTTAVTTGSSTTNTVITKLTTIPTWIGILITVALAFIVLGYFYGGRR